MREKVPTKNDAAKTNTYLKLVVKKAVEDINANPFASVTNWGRRRRMLFLCVPNRVIDEGFLQASSAGRQTEASAGLEPAGARR